MYFIGSLIYSTLVYWGVGGLYTILDLTLKPEVLRKYKVQPKTNEPVDKAKLTKVILQVLFNQFCVSMPLGYFSYIYLKGNSPPVRELPTLNRLILDLTVCLVLREITFYYSHRLFHMKYFYKRFHKQHHEWTSPIAVSASYAHPVEHVVANYFPAVVGIGVMNSHLITSWIYLTYLTVQTLSAHSGYHFPFHFSPEFHDYHHEKWVKFKKDFPLLIILKSFRFNYCYGSGILDWLHGTDIPFRKSVASKRYVTLTNLKSAREIFPDEIKKKNS